MTPRPLSLLLLACFCAGSMNSCRMALHTLPDSVGKKNFHTPTSYQADIYRCDGVLYAATKGYYKTPPAGLVEGYHIKLGDWQLWPDDKSTTQQQRQTDQTLYIPLTQQLVNEWNQRNKKSAQLSFERYTSDILTDEEMKQMQGKRTARGEVYGGLARSLQNSATQRNFAHYALQPITLPLKMVDAVSVVPLTGAVCVAGVLAAAVHIPILQVSQAWEGNEYAAPIPAEMPQKLQSPTP